MAFYKVMQVPDLHFVGKSILDLAVCCAMSGKEPVEAVGLVAELFFKFFVECEVHGLGRAEILDWKTEC